VCALQSEKCHLALYEQMLFAYDEIFRNAFGASILIKAGPEISIPFGNPKPPTN
jgi:hypothetical protein